MDHSEALSQIVSKWLAQSYNVEEFERPSWSRLVKAMAQCHVAGGDDETPRTYSLSVSSGIMFYTITLGQIN